MLADVSVEELYDPFQTLLDNNVLTRAQTYDEQTLKLWYDADDGSDASADIINALSAVEQRFTDEVPAVNRPCFTRYDVSASDGLVTATMNDVWFDGEFVVETTIPCSEEHNPSTITNYEDIYETFVVPSGFDSFNPDADPPADLVNWRARDFTVEKKKGYAVDSIPIRGADNVTLEEGNDIVTSSHP